MDYSADVDEVREILRDTVTDCPSWNGQGAADVWVVGVDRECVHIWLTAWADDPDKAWSLKAEILDKALQRLLDAGVPLPRRHVQVDEMLVEKGRLLGPHGK